MAKRYDNCNTMKRPSINLQRNRVNNTGNNNNVMLMLFTAVFPLLTVGFVISSSSFGIIQATFAQQQKNNNDNNNIAPAFSLSTFSTAIGTGAAATGAIVTVPGILRTRNQSKYLSIYLLKVHDTYHEICISSKGQTNNEKQEYLDRLDSLRREVIYLLQRREINENQYKMLDDRIIEYSGKIADLNQP